MSHGDRHAYSQPLSLPVVVGERAARQSASVGRVRAEAAGGQRAEPATDAGGPGGRVGPRHPAHQHAVQQGPAHAGVRQGLAAAHGVEAVQRAAPLALLLDAPAPRRQAVESRKRSIRCHPGARRRGRHTRAHAVQSYGISNLGRFVHTGAFARVRLSANIDSRTHCLHCTVL